MEKKLTRSTSNRKLAGVCGGLAEYFGLDASIIRIIWILAVVCGGVGILAYLIMWLVMPQQ